jgi:hypothetical protein
MAVNDPPLQPNNDELVDRFRVAAKEVADRVSQFERNTQKEIDSIKESVDLSLTKVKNLCWDLLNSEDEDTVNKILKKTLGETGLRVIDTALMEKSNAEILPFLVKANLADKKEKKTDRLIGKSIVMTTNRLNRKRQNQGADFRFMSLIFAYLIKNYFGQFLPDWAENLLVNAGVVAAVVGKQRTVRTFMHGADVTLRAVKASGGWALEKSIPLVNNIDEFIANKRSSPSDGYIKYNKRQELKNTLHEMSPHDDELVDKILYSKEPEFVEMRKGWEEYVNNIDDLLPDERVKLTQRIQDNLNDVIDSGKYKIKSAKEGIKDKFGRGIRQFKATLNSLGRGADKAIVKFIDVAFDGAPQKFLYSTYVNFVDIKVPDGIRWVKGKIFEGSRGLDLGTRVRRSLTRAGTVGAGGFLFVTGFSAVGFPLGVPALLAGLVPATVVGAGSFVYDSVKHFKVIKTGKVILNRLGKGIIAGAPTTLAGAGISIGLAATGNPIPLTIALAPGILQGVAVITLDTLKDTRFLSKLLHETDFKVEINKIINATDRAGNKIDLSLSQRRALQDRIDRELAKSKVLGEDGRVHGAWDTLHNFSDKLEGALKVGGRVIGIDPRRFSFEPLKRDLRLKFLLDEVPHIGQHLAKVPYTVAIKRAIGRGFGWALPGAIIGLALGGGIGGAMAVAGAGYAAKVGASMIYQRNQAYFDQPIFKSFGASSNVLFLSLGALSLVPGANIATIVAASAATTGAYATGNWIQKKFNNTRSFAFGYGVNGALIGANIVAFLGAPGGALGAVAIVGASAGAGALAGVVNKKWNIIKPNLAFIGTALLDIGETSWWVNHLKQKWLQFRKEGGTLPQFLLREFNPLASNGTGLLNIFFAAQSTALLKQLNDFGIGLTQKLVTKAFNLSGVSIAKIFSRVAPWTLAGTALGSIVGSLIGFAFGGGAGAVAGAIAGAATGAQIGTAIGISIGLGITFFTGGGGVGLVALLGKVGGFIGGLIGGGIGGFTGAQTEKAVNQAIDRATTSINTFLSGIKALFALSNLLNLNLNTPSGIISLVFTLQAFAAISATGAINSTTNTEAQASGSQSSYVKIIANQELNDENLKYASSNNNYEPDKNQKVDWYYFSNESYVSAPNEKSKYIKEYVDNLDIGFFDRYNMASEKFNFELYADYLECSVNCGQIYKEIDSSSYLNNSDLIKVALEKENKEIANLHSPGEIYDYYLKNNNVKLINNKFKLKDINSGDIVFMKENDSRYKVGIIYEITKDYIHINLSDWERREEIFVIDFNEKIPSFKSNNLEIIGFGIIE